MAGNAKSPFPPNNVAPLGPDGQFSRVWLDFFVAIFRRTGAEGGFDLSALKLLVDQLQAALKVQAGEIDDIDVQLAERSTGSLAGQVADMFAALSAHVDAQIAQAFAAAQRRDEGVEIDALVAQAAAASAARSDDRGDAGESSAVGYLERRINELEVRLAEGFAIAVDQVSGLGTMSTQNANSVAITGGSVQASGTLNSAVATGGEAHVDSISGTAFGRIYFRDSDNNFGFFVSDSGGTATRLRIIGSSGAIRIAESAGNVLIGTATDNGSDKLQVNGSIAMSPTTTTTAPAAGGAGALPATPTGYANIRIGGTVRKIAYY
jgi:hypothetical protein